MATWENPDDRIQHALLVLRRPVWRGRAMTLSLALVQVGLRIGSWILPWVAVIFVSATLVFAVNASTGEGTGPADVERLTTSPSAQSADLGPIVTPDHCPPIGSG